MILVLLKVHGSDRQLASMRPCLPSPVALAIPHLQATEDNLRGQRVLTASGHTSRLPAELLTGGCVNSLSPEFTTRFGGSVTWFQLCRQESASQPTTQRALNAFKFSHGCCVCVRGLSPRWKSLSFHGRGEQEIFLAERHERKPSYVRRSASGISSAESSKFHFGFSQEQDAFGSSHQEDSEICDVHSAPPP